MNMKCRSASPSKTQKQIGSEMSNIDMPRTQLTIVEMSKVHDNSQAELIDDYY